MVCCVKEQPGLLSGEGAFLLSQAWVFFFLCRRPQVFLISLCFSCGYGLKVFASFFILVFWDPIFITWVPWAFNPDPVSPQQDSLSSRPLVFSPASLVPLCLLHSGKFVWRSPYQRQPLTSENFCYWQKPLSDSSLRKDSSVSDFLLVWAEEAPENSGRKAVWSKKDYLLDLGAISEDKETPSNALWTRENFTQPWS